jgi:hypothetical protein
MWEKQSQNPSERVIKGKNVWTGDYETSINPDATPKMETSADDALSAMEQSSIKYATPVGQHAVPVVRPDGESVSDVQPVALREIGEAILRNKVGGEAGTNKFQNDELVSIEELSNKQYDEMHQIREGIQEMVSLFRNSGGSSSGGGEGVGSPNKGSVATNVGPKVFGQMRDGKPGGGPNRSVQKYIG